MTDVFDRAQEREAEMRQDALNERARNAPHLTGVSAEACIWCDQAIPEGRRMAIPGVQTCIECQTDIERRGAADWGMAE